MAALKLGAFDFIVKRLDQALVVLAVHLVVRHCCEALTGRPEISQRPTGSHQTAIQLFLRASP